jgi:hypothetical protein
MFSWTIPPISVPEEQSVAVLKVSGQGEINCMNSCLSDVQAPLKTPAAGTAHAAAALNSRVRETPEGNMRKAALGLAASSALAILAPGAASAFPVAPLSEVASPVEQVRLVCDDFGRCWRTGPRYYRYGYGPRFYGPRYGYYGPRYRYGPGVSFGGPGFGFRFGL